MMFQIHAKTSEEINGKFRETLQMRNKQIERMIDRM